MAGSVAELQSLNFGMVLNLQETGEHAHCGPGLLAASGLTYLPDTFMQAGIGYFHMCWQDMSTPNLAAMTHIVQVMHHVCHDQRQRIAVHCHAGLGRTGLAIACYLVFSGSAPLPAAAIKHVRSKRPGSLQTKAQEAFVYVFEKWLQHLRCICCSRHAQPLAARAHCATGSLWNDALCVPSRLQLDTIEAFKPKPPGSLRELVLRQKYRLHGAVLRHYWNVPALLVDLLQVQPCTFISCVTLSLHCSFAAAAWLSDC